MIKDTNKLKILRTALFLAAAASLIFGIYRGEVLTVLEKATMVCLECIGIG